MSPTSKAKDPGWGSGDILRATVIVAGVFVALQLLWVGRSVVLLGFFGMLLGITLSAGVDRLEKLRVPRGVGAVLIVAVAIAALVGLGFLTAPQITKQVGELQQQVPQAIDRAEQWIQQRGGGVAELIQAPESPPAPAGKADSTEGDTATAATVGAGSSRESKPEPGSKQETKGPPVDLRQSMGQQLSGVTKHFFAVFSSTVSVIGGIILLLFVSIFIAAEPGLYHRGLMHLFPHRTRAKAGEVLSATATTLRRWLVMQFLAMLVIGGVTTVALLLIGVKAAVALGIIAGLLEFIPYVGPILSAVPAIAMGLVDGPDKALYVVLAYIAIQQLEGVVLQPLLMKEGLELPPVMTLLGQALFAMVFGFMGLLLAVPMLATVMIPVKMLYVRDVVGDEVTVPGEDE